MSSSSTQPSPAPHGAPRRRRRSQQVQCRKAWQRPLATEFAGDPLLSDPLFLVETLKGLAGICDDLLADAKPAYAGGRRRKDGAHWPLLYLAFLCSDIIDVKTWCERWRSSSVWELCGFTDRPNYRTVWLRFTELESYADAFQRAAQKLIAIAAAADDRVGRHVHVDATHFTTHARLIHCCPDPVECARLWAAQGGGAKPKKVLTKAPDDLVKAERHKAQAGPEPAPGTRPQQLASVALDDRRLADLDEDELQRHAFFELRGHLYKTRDLTAGVRYYAQRTNPNGPGRKEKFTEGGQLLMASCDYVGAPVAVYCASVGQQEWDAYPHLWERVEAALDDRPEAMVTDRGFAVGSVYEHNTRRRVSTIAPWRQPHPDVWPEDLECDRFDRHGIVRCTHCGGPTHINGPGLGLYFDGDEPRLRVECALQHTTKCGQSQSIACSAEWRLLQPIRRTDELFHALQHANRNKESLFHHWRRRYGVAGNDFAERPKRRQSVPCQMLRASAGLLVEWLRICLRHGWVSGAVTVNAKDPVERDGGTFLARRVVARTPRRRPRPALRRSRRPRRSRAVGAQPCRAAAARARAGAARGR